MKKQEELRYAVGVDFGGTSVKMALVNDRGQIKGRKKIATKDIATREAWLDAVAQAVAELRSAEAGAGKSFAGVGVGVPGFVDFDRGFIYDLANVPGWTGVHLAELLGTRLGMHVRVDNDVNVMALGECTFGSGRTYQHAVFVTLGTGVGGGLLINNKLYRGAYSMAGEIGHMSIDMYGRKSPQGRGGLEQYVGNRRIIERAVEEMEKGRPSLLKELCGGDFKKLAPEVIEAAAEKGDALSLEVWDYVADCLAAAFSSVVYLIQPQAIIIGGGVGTTGRVLFDPMRRHLDERLSPFFAERIEIKRAELGNDAGVIGAATLALME